MADADAPAAIATMDAYLEQTLGVANQGMRDKIVAAGFTNMDVLISLSGFIQIDDEVLESPIIVDKS